MYRQLIGFEKGAKVAKVGANKVHSIRLTLHPLTKLFPLSGNLFLTSAQQRHRMENTPPKRILRQRHTPTPKISERKKALFSGHANNNKQSSNLPATIDEDSDLGPMSPLQFSCSPSTYDSPFMRTRSGNGAHTPSTRAPTDFSNIMAHLSPRKLSDQYEALTITPKRQTTTTTPKRSNDNVYGSPQPEHRNATTILEKENLIGHVQKIVQKTPTTVVQPQTNADYAVLRLVNRKSLIFGDSNPASTPETPEMQSSAIAAESAATESSRARASLQFAEQQTAVISTRSFYGSNADK